LGKLGAKGIRLQGGWAKCEKQPGVYSWEWLDKVVDDALSQGVQPWIQTSYGNPIYNGGGTTGLGGSLPSSPEALAAWDNWVRALVQRYKDRVKEWEIWNEPDLNAKHPTIGSPVTAEDYAKLFIRTAEIIDARMQGRDAFVTVKFVSEQVNATRDADGAVVEGDPNKVETITDLWTFTRNTRARDPNWFLAETATPQ
jgi:hypothetical protein